MAETIPSPPALSTGREWEPYAIPGVNVMLRRYKGPRGPDVPTIDPNYHFREEMVRELAWAAWPHDGGEWSPCLLAGGKGSGKTTLVLQVAAHCNIPVYRLNCNSGTTSRHLKGRVVASKGGTNFSPGVATRAMEEGAWLLLDELAGLSPDVALTLFPILEPDGAVLLEDAMPARYVNRHPDFRIFGTDNSIGASQEATRFNYAGTNRVNSALLDRFHSFIEVPYMDKEDEFRVAKALAPGIEDVDLEGIILTASNIRNSDSGIAFSTRMVIAWARRVAAGTLYADGTRKKADDRDIYEAAGPAFLNKMNSVQARDLVKEALQTVYGFEFEDED